MRLRCVIVDDSPTFLESASTLLEQEGMDVVGAAANSAEGLRVVEDLQPDVTLVDIDLGDENGFELARALSLSGNGHSNVILISTHAESDVACLLEASSALGYVSKARFSAKAISEILESAKDS
jgi:DNA-binding NarL/FixJ family response regulator